MHFAFLDAALTSLATFLNFIPKDRAGSMSLNVIDKGEMTSNDLNFKSEYLRRILFNHETQV